ncbi:NADAR family protein [Brevibacillus gelatini]|uniref:NADAR family protein n=1 Tax=Brevibacillus gelatini TaxID=1655277 RepID=UPI003D812DF7
MKTEMEKRVYKRSEAIVFRKTKEEFGGLSNMASGFPIKIGKISIYSSEALYQACRYPDNPEIQRKIISEKSPMTAKMKSKAFREYSRKDWDDIRIQVMRWCIRVKLLQNWQSFSILLLSTKNLPIVEESKRDAFWGAIPHSNELLVGTNALGRLLMELRSEMISYWEEGLYTLKPPKIDNFKLLDEYVPGISVEITQISSRDKREVNIQQTLFDLC